MLKDPKFNRDRADYMGVRRTKEEAAALRPEAVHELQRAMRLLETTLLADGRDWLLKTEGPTLADIEAVWPLHWMIKLPEALPPHLGEQFPKVYAWVERFSAATSAARKTAEKAETVSGEEAQKLILSSAYNEDEPSVDAEDQTAKFYGLQKGDMVQLWPIDSGSGHKDTGNLGGSERG